MRWLFLIVFLVSSGAGCSKQAEKKAPTCAEVTDHVLAIVQVAYPGHGDMGGRGNRDLEIQQCEARKVSAKERRCIVAAKDMAGIAACRKGTIRNDFRGDAKPPAPTPTVPPVPAPATAPTP